MKKILLPVLFSLAVAVCRADGPYHFIKEIPVGGDGGWDYLTVDSAGQRLYVSHQTKVVVIDLAKDQVVGKVNETLVPQLRKLPGFAGYYLIEAGNGVLSSLGVFETSEQGDESTKIVAKWLTDENFSTAIPNAPKITSGKVVVHSNGVPVA